MADRREPHARHLAEMRASQPDATAMDEFRAIVAAVPCRALTGAELQAARTRYAADREAERLRQCYPDPTRWHLMEMRLSILEQRHADGLIDAREFAARHPEGGAAVDREVVRVDGAGRDGVKVSRG